MHEGKGLMLSLQGVANVKRPPSSRGPVLALLMVLSLCVPFAPSAAEDTDFIPRHTGVDYPVGWTDIDTNPFNPAFNVQLRLVYPAMEDGEDAEMAGNGPFPWIAFFGDNGEASDDYMLLSSALAKRGYITISSGALSDSSDIEANGNTLSVMRERVNQTNSGQHVTGGAENIDYNHWAIAGHGTGAAAAYLLQPFLTVWDHPPRGVVGLGTDFEGLDEDWDWDDGPSEPQFFTPKAGLFMTGTVDEVAPSQEALDRLKELDGIGWHWMHVLGADHYQFQDTRSIFENEADASLTQEEQIALAAGQIVPYLDTTIRGDHGQFRAAFNRPSDPYTVSHPQAYIQEDLSTSEWIRFENTTASHPPSSQLNGSEDLEVSVDWVLRNGDAFLDIPADWDVRATCGWRIGPHGATTTMSPNGTVQCVLPMATVPPGAHELVVRVDVEGGGAEWTQTYQRENTPMELVEPKPTVYVPQHGERILNMSEVAVDPDGQIVRATNVALNCTDADHFGVSIVEDGQAVRAFHALDEEWLGECDVEVNLRSDGETDDVANTSLRVVLTPVDDPVVVLAPVPIQELTEDGDARMYDVRSAVYDPEETPLQFTIDGAASGQQGPVQFAFADNVLTLTPLPDAFGAIVLRAVVSDGTQPGVDIEVPVVVMSVDDPIRINASAWTNLTTQEDASVSLDVDALAYDVDGDELNWTLEQQHDELSVVFENGTFTVAPAPDVFGVFEGLWLNVSDGSSNHSAQLSLRVMAEPDPPIVSITSVQRMEGLLSASMQWVVSDVDGEVDTNGSVLVDGVLLNVSHSCLSSNDGVHQCVTLLPLSPTTSPVYVVELRIVDEPLNRTVVASYTLEAGATMDTDQDAALGDESGGITGSDVALLMFVLLLAVVGGVLALRRSGSTSETEIFTHLNDDEVVEESSQSASSSGGLMARAERLK